MSLYYCRYFYFLIITKDVNFSSVQSRWIISNYILRHLLVDKIGVSSLLTLDEAEICHQLIFCLVWILSRRRYLVTGLGQAGGINCVASPHWLVDSPRSWGRCCLGGSITDNLMWQYCDTSPLNTNYKHISISVTSFYQFGSETQRWEASLGLVQIYIIDRYKYKPVTTASGLWIWRFQIDQFWYNLNVLFLFCIYCII